MEALNKFQERFDGMSKVDKARALGALDREYEEQKKLDFIRKDFKPEYGNRIINITNIDDKFQIVEYEHRIRGVVETLYSTYVDFQRTNMSAYTFDKALLICLDYKYNGINSQGALFMAKMLGMKEEA